MQNYNVILTWEAIYDITDIAEYIEAEFGKERADCFQDDIRKQMKDLEMMGSFLSKTSLLVYGVNIFGRLKKMINRAKGRGRDVTSFLLCMHRKHVLMESWKNSLQICIVCIMMNNTKR